MHLQSPSSAESQATPSPIQATPPESQPSSPEQQEEAEPQESEQQQEEAESPEESKQQQTQADSQTQQPATFSKSVAVQQAFIAAASMGYTEVTAKYYTHITRNVLLWLKYF